RGGQPGSCPRLRHPPRAGDDGHVAHRRRRLGGRRHDARHQAHRLAGGRPGAAAAGPRRHPPRRQRQPGGRGRRRPRARRGAGGVDRLRRLHLQDRLVLRRAARRAAGAAARPLRTHRGSALMDAYLAAIAIIALIYMLLSLGLTLQYGLTGLINFGHVGFFAIGAYTSALLSLQGLPLALTIPAAAVTAGLAAWPIGLISLR